MLTVSHSRGEGCCCLMGRVSVWDDETYWKEMVVPVSQHLVAFMPLNYVCPKNGTIVGMGGAGRASSLDLPFAPPLAPLWDANAIGIKRKVA